MNTPFSRHTIQIVFITSLLLASCSPDESEQKSSPDDLVLVQITQPLEQSFERITISGQIESQETAFISTRMMGFISSIKVQPGDRVQKGQLLATISNGDILAKQAQAEAMIMEANAALKDARKDYERFEDLFKQQSATAKELENTTLRYQSVKAKAEAALQMKNETDVMLTYANLVAPFNGVVTSKNNQEGSMANPGMPILTIERPDRYQVSASVSENEISKVKIGMSARITIKSTGKELTGTVIEISPSSHFTGGEFHVKINIPRNENADLFSGMYVNADIAVGKSGGASSLFVPASALIQKGQMIGLYMVSSDLTAQLRWLKVGRKYGDQVEVLSGISAGEAFITQSNGRLFSGASVLIKK